MSKIVKKQIIYVNSADSIPLGVGSYSFSITLDQPNNYNRVTLLQASIPKSFYGIVQGINTFILLELSDEVIISIPQGNYTRQSLANTLASLLTSSSPNNWTYTVTFQNINVTQDDGKFTFTVSGNAGFQPSFIFGSSTSSDIFEPMGFNSSTTNVFSTNTLRSSNVINLQPFQTIQVHSNVVLNPRSSYGNYDILQNIVANSGSSPYSNISYLCPAIEEYSHELSSGNTGVMNITLTAEDSIPINLNGVNFQLAVCFWEKSESLFKLDTFIKFITHFINRKYFHNEDEIERSYEEKL